MKVFLLLLLVTVVLVPLTAEVLVRLKIRYLEWRFERNASLTQSDYNFLWLPVTSAINYRIWNYFLTDQADPRLRSPIQEREPLLRMEHARTHTGRYRLGPGDYDLIDFTRFDTGRAKFHAHIGRHGFRGPDRPLTSGRYRIVCWGAYQTFGHGVEDRDTYPAQLEAALNSGGKHDYAVWNGGVQSISLNLAEQRFAADLEDIRPQVAVLEFGFVDMTSMKNDAFINPGERVFAYNTYYWRLSREFFSWLYTGPLGRTYLMALLSQKATSSGGGENLIKWKEEMRAAIAMLNKRGVYVIVMNQNAGGFDAREYADLVRGNEKATFFDTKKVLGEFLVKHPQPRDVKPWIEEFDEHTRKVVQSGPMYPLKKNFTHPDELAYHVMAEELAKTIRAVRFKKPSRLATVAPIR